MTEENTAAPAAATDTSAPSTETPAPVTTPAQVGEPNWLKDRIAQAKGNALKEAGFESIEAAKEAALELKRKIDSEKSAELRASELKAETETLKAQTTTQAKLLAEVAARQMVGLTEEQKAAVMQIAGEDPTKQLAAISAMQPTWTKQAQAAVANTAPPPNGPAPATGSQPNSRAAYEDMRRTNPFAAATYGLSHGEVYDPSKSK